MRNCMKLYIIDLVNTSHTTEDTIVCRQILQNTHMRSNTHSHVPSFSPLQPADLKDDFFASFSESPPPSSSQQPQQQAQAKDVDLFGGAMEDSQPAAAVS